jgi:hypothetical protein
MVKADIKKDYYADLELPSTADTEEIKKQFRLLGKIMPDVAVRASLTVGSQTVSSRPQPWP